MIDTVKIYTQITKELYQKIEFCQNHKICYNKSTGQLFYDITSDNLEGSYSTSLSVKVGEGAKYGFINSYCIEVEGSLHKMLQGQNAYNGYYNLVEVAIGMIKLVEDGYNVILPNIKHWFLQRCDISKCFDLEKQENVVNYLGCLSYLSYPRRNVLPYGYTKGIYVAGTSTTLKIYDKLLEFMKHDSSKVKKINFDIDKHINTIQGFVRFECEIKKKKAETLRKSYRNHVNNKKYLDNNHVRLYRVTYDQLEKIWVDEFIKLLKLPENEEKRKMLANREDVKNYLENNCTKRGQANRLYAFYIQLKLEGYDKVKSIYSKTAFYRNISELKEFGINWTSTEFEILEVKNENYYYFNPFTMKEVV